MINGVTQLIMTKADVLCDFDVVKVCTHYQYKKEIIDYLPYDINDELKPIYKEMKSWHADIRNVNSIDDIPVELSDYIRFLEEELNVPITMISTGPDRTQTLIREDISV